MARNLVGPYVVAFVLSLAVSAHAQEVSPDEAAATIFDQGVALMTQGRYGEACAKFARSQELAPTGGTLLALADCYDKNGQPASAWAAYKTAAERAAAAKQSEAERVAREAVKRLEGKISRLTIDASSASALAGLVVTIDGRAVGSSELGAPLPLDPGAHVVRATAPGRVAWESRITVGSRPTNEVLAVPMLLEPTAERAPAAPPAAGEEGTAPSSNGQRVAGIAVGGAGIVGLLVGAGFGLHASAKNDEAASHCRDEVRCSAEGMRLHQDTRDAATVSTIAFVVGGVSVAVGAVLYFTASRGAAAPAMTVGARATAGGGSFGVSGTF